VPPQCDTCHLVSLSTFLNRGSAPDGCALGAHVTAGGDASANVDSGSQSSAYFRPNQIARLLPAQKQVILGKVNYPISLP
jgi:hypothetical protein